MKQLILIGVFSLCGLFSTQAQRLELGTTTAVFKNPTRDDFVSLKKAGIKYVEVALNQCYRGVDPEDVMGKIDAMKSAIDSAELTVWSIHLPFSKTLDISVLDDDERNANVDFIATMIRKSAMFSPKRLVIHPSSEPIDQGDREQRMINAISSIKQLKPVADEIGAILCIENLPRTCLGCTPEELVEIVDEVNGVGVCFDTNHYFKGSTQHFMEVVGRRIKHLHCSDYDFVQECHWLPTQGDINWGRLMSDLEVLEYEGVFMYEATKDRETLNKLTPQQLMQSFEAINKDYKNYNK